MRYAFLGGGTFDPVAVADYLKGLPAGSMVVTGNGRGFEQYVREQAPEFGHTVWVVDERTDLYDFDPKKPQPLGTPPDALTRLHMYLRVPQAIAYAKRIAAERKGEKIRQALDMQVYDILVEALHGVLVLAKGGRADLARDQLKGVTIPIEVIEL